MLEQGGASPGMTGVLKEGVEAEAAEEAAGTRIGPGPGRSQPG